MANLTESRYGFHGKPIYSETGVSKADVINISKKIENFLTTIEKACSLSSKKPSVFGTQDYNTAASVTLKECLAALSLSALENTMVANTKEKNNSVLEQSGHSSESDLTQVSRLAGG